MPYRNIVYVRLRMELLMDNRFLTLSDDGKLLFIGLLLLAGATNNNIPNDISYIKNRLSLEKDVKKIGQSLDEVLGKFPKIYIRGGKLKFRNFNRFHNPLRDKNGNAQGAPKASRSLANSIVIVIEEYSKEKGWSSFKEDKVFREDTIKRYARAAKQLLQYTKGNVNLAFQAIKWTALLCDKRGLSWTLETVLKKWGDFLGAYGSPKYRELKEELKKK